MMMLSRWKIQGVGLGDDEYSNIIDRESWMEDVSLYLDLEMEDCAYKTWWLQCQQLPPHSF
jgi:hypothetical protein